MSPGRTLLGFDYGKKRIGVAVGQELTGSSSPVATLEPVQGAPDWEGIARLIESWRPSGLVVGILQVTADEEVMIITQMGKLIRLNTEQLRTIGRVTQGVRLITLEDGERVVSIAKIMESEDEDEEGAPLN